MSIEKLLALKKLITNQSYRDKESTITHLQSQLATDTEPDLSYSANNIVSIPSNYTHRIPSDIYQSIENSYPSLSFILEHWKPD